MPRRLGQQRMTWSDLERPFHASRAISVVTELLAFSLWCGGLRPRGRGRL